MDDDHPSGTNGSPVVANDPDKPVAAAKKINVNTATKAELMTLPGIGEVLAKRIIAGRPYAKIEDLKKIKGIGNKILTNFHKQTIHFRFPRSARRG